MNLPVPAGMNRRHFMKHLATSAATIPALDFLFHVQANAAEVRRNQKSCILMWMNGGPPSIDIWDLKPGARTNRFQPISTKGDLQISEYMPRTATVMDNLSVVRSMSTQEADHGRGRYYMHTAFKPNPTVVHPTFGSVVSYELAPKRPDLEIPAFVAINGASGSPGYLGMAHSPFMVRSNGQIRNLPDGLDPNRLNSRLAMLDVIETSFINSKRGESPKAHQEVYGKAVNLMKSEQMKAFRVMDEPADVQDKYGRTPFGQGLLMARRLVEEGVPFIEVDFGGWDLHTNNFATLQNQRLPVLDQGIAALAEDLKERGLLDHTVLVWMGEFGRTPRINADDGRDHWAASWAVMMGGGGLKGGIAVGETDAEGMSVVGKSFSPGNVWATVAQALGVPLDTVHTSKRGRPMKIADGAAPISELLG